MKKLSTAGLVLLSLGTAYGMGILTCAVCETKLLIELLSAYKK